jgi:hypothetical protein
LLALPRPLGPVRRDENPLAGQGIVTAVGMVAGMENRRCSSCNRTTPAPGCCG